MIVGDSRVLLLLAVLLAFGIARPIGTVAGAAGVVAEIPRELRGLSSALAQQARQLGAALSVAVLGLVITTVEAARRPEALGQIHGSLAEQEREVIDGLLAGSDRARQELAALPAAAQEAAAEAVADMYSAGFAAAMVLVGLVALTAAAGAAVLIRPRPAADENTGSSPLPSLD
jgi:hypothetical protein